MPKHFSKDLTGTPRVSVIVPTYNNAQYIGQALDSVLSQNYADYEIIVIDDGSTDGTQQALEPYQEQIRYLYQQNAGSAVARNTGLDLARGEFIVFLDADDLLLPGKLRAQSAFLQLNPAVGMVHSGWRVIDAQGNLLQIIEPWHQALHLDVEGWFKHKPVRMGAMMIRRIWLDCVGGFDPQIRQSQDVDLMLRLALAGCTTEWMFIHTMCYRQYPASTIRRNALKQHGYVVRVMDKFHSHPLIPESLRKSENQARYFQLRWLIWHIYQSGYPAGIVAPLKQAVEYSPYSLTETIFDLSSRLIRFFMEDNRDVHEFPSLWPYFRQAISLDTEYWQQIIGLQNWCIEQLVISRNPVLVEAHKLWSFFQFALQEEPGSSVTAETMVEWWVYVWLPYLDAKPRQGAKELARFEHLNAEQITELAQLCIVYSPNRVSQDSINRFWADVNAAGLVPPADFNNVVTLYLTYFGQEIMGKEWQNARNSLSAAVSAGFSPTVLKAWRRFLGAVLDYYPIGNHHSTDILFVGITPKPDNHLVSLIKSLKSMNLTVAVSSQRQRAIKSLGLTKNDWLSDKMVVGLVNSNLSGKSFWAHGQFLRRLRGQGYEYRHFRRLPLLGKPWQVIYISSLDQAISTPELFNLGYPTILRCTAADICMAQVEQDHYIRERIDQAFIKATAIHCLSEIGKRMALSIGVNEAKISVIKPGVDTGFFAPPETSLNIELPLRIVMTDPFTWWSGYEYTLVALGLLHEQNIPFQLTLIGDGPEKTRILFTIHDLDLGSFVTWHPLVTETELRQHLQAADVYLSGSLTDEPSVELLTGMACGLPVVTAGTLDDMASVRCGVEGYVVPFRDPPALTEALSRLAANPSQRCQLGQAAHQRIVKHYSLEHQNKVLRNLYHTVRARS